MNKTFLLSAMLLVVLLGGCGSGGSDDSGGSGVTKPLLSVGLTPFDEADPQGYLSAINELVGNVSTVQLMVPLQWTTVCSPGQSLTEAYRDYQWLPYLAEQGLSLSLAQGFLESNDRSKMRVPPNCALPSEEFRFSSVKVREALVEELRYVSSAFAPKYLTIGIEIEQYFHQNPAEVAPFVEGFSKARDAISEVSPTTEVLFSFQFENTAKLNDRWSTVKRLVNALDIKLVGVSSYPQVLQQSSGFQNSSAFPSDFYDSIKSNLGSEVRVLFSELAATVLASSVYDPGPDPEADQLAFIDNFFGAVHGLRVELVNWSFYYDPNFISACDSSCNCKPRGVYDSGPAMFFSGTGLKPNKCGPARGISRREAWGRFKG